MIKEFNPFDILMGNCESEDNIINKEQQKIEELIKPLQVKITMLKEQIEIWNNKEYKSNTKTVKVGYNEYIGDSIYKEGEQNIRIDYINNRRRIKKIESLQEDIKDIQKHIKAIENKENYFDFDTRQSINYREII